MKRVLNNQIAGLSLAALLASTTFTGCSMELSDSSYFDCAEKINAMSGCNREISDSSYYDEGQKEASSRAIIIDKENKSTSNKSKNISAITTEEEWVIFTDKQIEEAKTKVPGKFSGIEPVKGGCTQLVGYVFGLAEGGQTKSQKYALKAMKQLSEYGAKFLDGLIDKFTFGMGSIVTDFLFSEGSSKSNPVLDAVCQLRDDVADCKSEIEQLNQRMNDMFAANNEQQLQAISVYLKTSGGEASVMKQGRGLLSYSQYEAIAGYIQKDNLLEYAKNYFSSYTTISRPYTIPMFYRKYAEETYPFRYQSNKFLTMLIANDIAVGTETMSYLDEVTNPYKPNVCLNELIEIINSNSYFGNMSDKETVASIMGRYTELETALHKEFMLQNFENSEDMEKAVSEITKKELLFIAELAANPEYAPSREGSKSLLELYKERVESLGGSYTTLCDLFNRFLEMVDYSIVPAEMENQFTFNVYNANEGKTEYISVYDQKIVHKYRENFDDMRERYNSSKHFSYWGENNKTMLYTGHKPIVVNPYSNQYVRIEGWYPEEEGTGYLAPQALMITLDNYYKKNKLTNAPFVKTSLGDGTWIIQKDESKATENKNKSLSNILYYGAGLQEAFKDIVIDNRKADLIYDDYSRFSYDFDWHFFDDPTAKVIIPSYTLWPDHGVERYDTNAFDHGEWDYFRTFRKAGDKDVRTWFNYNKK